MDCRRGVAASMPGVLWVQLLVQSCMPSAQNLVLLMNLTPETSMLAPGMARLLLRQILLSAIPMTVWISIFMTYLGIPIG